MPRASKKMSSQKNRLNKKGSILAISGLTLVFSVISILYIFISLFMFATANDYLFYELQNMTETMQAQGSLQPGISNLTQTFGDTYTGFNLHLDDIWLIAYVVFLFSSFVVSYQSRRESYFGFLGYLFYGVLFILFLLTFFDVIANWFNTEILTAILPSAIITAPKFYFYLDNVGIFSAVQLVICIIINQMDFDFSKIRQRKKQEEAALEQDEVL